MNSAVLVMFLAASGAVEGSGLSFDGAATAYLAPATNPSGGSSIAAGTHLRLHLGYEFESFFVEGRASLLLSYSTFGLFQDLGSQLSVGYRPHGFLEELRLTLWPFNSVTALPVFDWANHLGIAPLEFAPAVSLQASSSAGSLWVTSRFRSSTNTYSNLFEVRPDLFFGANARLPSGFQFDARAAWFQYGQIPSLGMSGVKAVSDGFVASGRLSWTLNEYVGPAMDFDFYGSDPWRFERFFVPEPRMTRVAVWAAIEGGGGSQKLIDPGAFASTKSQPLGWADAQLRVRVSETRLFITGRLHTTSFDAAIGPGLPPYVAFLDGSTQQPKLEALAGFDTTWRAAHLTPGILVRLTRASVLQSPRFDFGGSNPQPGLTGPRVVALYGDNVIAILPYGSKVLPQMAVKFSLKWEPVSFMTVAGELNLVKDFNDQYFDDGDGGTSRVTPKLAVRGQLLVQARF